MLASEYIMDWYSNRTVTSIICDCYIKEYYKPGSIWIFEPDPSDLDIAYIHSYVLFGGYSDVRDYKSGGRYLLNIVTMTTIFILFF